ncbi:MAG: hypothetical protein HY671_01465 [Chloroflexi bacterium]|nr:hypothetical protein [Chloroflexota bacterium]
MIAGKTQGRASEVAAAWAWVVQRVTAAFLLFFLGSHLWVLHFSLGDEKITFVRVTERLKQPFFQMLDMVLLAVVLYHALYGARSIALDFNISKAGKRALTWGLIVLGLGGFLYGSVALSAFFRAM